MKKLLLAALALCLLMGAACAESAGFEPLHISLWCDAAAGYEWTCEYDDTGVIAAPMEEFIEQEDGGMQDYYFGVLAPGTAEIIFNYGVNWDVAVPEKTVICSVHVDEAGSATVRWAETFSDDHIILIELPSNPTTGWGWTYQEDESGMVTLLSESYEATDDHLLGAGGRNIYQLKVEKPGETLLLFNHSQLWDPNAAADETYAVVVSVNEDMEISLTIDE